MTESDFFTQICVKSNIPATIPISFMYTVTDGSAILNVGKLYIDLQYTCLYVHILACINNT